MGERGEKRLRAEEEDVFTETEVCTDLDTIREIARDVRRYVLRETSKVSKAADSYILERMADSEDVLLKVILQCECFQALLEEIEKFQRGRKEVNSYSACIGSKVAEGKKRKGTR